LGSIERELEVYLGNGQMQGAAWRPRDDYRRHAAEILLDGFAGGHAKADPEKADLELCPLPGPLLVRFQHPSARVEASVLRGKANDYGPRHAEDGVRMLIQHRIQYRV
jgi:hypothetical protein